MRGLVAVLEDGSEVPGALHVEDWAQTQFTKAGESECNLSLLCRAYQARARRIEKMFGKSIKMFKYIERDEYNERSKAS